ncbi:unnamed protein product [Rhizophagus irregularis]|nr:unnamed protein product [Rhizophagus irregularis]
MEIYEITFEEKTPLYHSSQEIFSEETEEDLDTSFDELFDDENEEEFGTYEDQEVPPPPVEDANEPVYRLNPAMYTNFSPCILIDYLDNKLQTCGQTKNVRNLCQLVEVWQIDENAVSEYQSKGIPLGVSVELDVKIIYGKCGENISKFHVLVSIHVMQYTNAKVSPSEFLMMFQQFDIFVIIVTNLMVGI